MTLATILVTDGEQRAALASVRSLGRAGYRVLVAEGTRRSLAGRSRHATRAFTVPAPLADPAGFQAAIRGIVEQERVDLLLPVSEPSLLALLGCRESLGGCRIPFPSLEIFRRVTDKAAVLALAPEVGIQVPAQRVLHRRSEAKAIEAGAVPFPVVLKPARSVAEGVQLTVLHAADAAEFHARIARLPEAAFPVLVQRRIVGPGSGVFLLLWDGEVQAQFAHRRLREKPPSGGVSVYSESIPGDPGLLARSRELLERLQWQGVAMVEYKIDATTGTPYLMEINGRLWGSLQLAIDAGVDFPALLVGHALGGRPAPVLAWRSGVRLRWEWGNVDFLQARLRRTNVQLSLPPDAPGRCRSLREGGLVWRPGDRLEILRAADPAPFLLESWRRLLWQA